MFHRRALPTPAKEEDVDEGHEESENLVHDDSDKKRRRRKRQRRPASSSVSSRVSMAVIGLILFLLVGWWLDALPQRLVLSPVHAVGLVSQLPLGLSLILATASSSLSGLLLPLAWCLAVTSTFVPKPVSAGIAAIALVAMGLATRPAPSSSSDQNVKEKKSTKRASPQTVLLSTFAMVTVLLLENFWVWVVSATWPPGWDDTIETPPSLQDNGRLVLQSLLRGHGFSKANVLSLRRFWNVPWALVTCFFTALALVQLQGRRGSGAAALYAVCSRAVQTLALARFIRSVSFVVTVLPHPKSPQCYVQHRGWPVPPPPLWSRDFFLVGLQPASAGGCNDLIISGHATVTTTLACVIGSVTWDQVARRGGRSKDRSARAAALFFSAHVFWMLALDFAVEVWEGFHYTVDMWLGAILVVLLYKVLGPAHDLEIDDPPDSLLVPPPGDKSLNSPSSWIHRNLLLSTTMTRQEVITVSVFCFPALMAYLQLVLWPPILANPMIVAYVLVTVALYAQSLRLQQQPPVGGTAPRTSQQQRQPIAARAEDYVHLAQHTLLCLLYMALGVYL